MNTNDTGEPKRTNWWKVLLIITLFPFYITYWIFQQPWERNSRLLAITVLWLTVFFIGGSYRIRSLEMESAYKQSKITEVKPVIPSPTPTITPEPLPTNNPQTVSSSPSPTPTSTPTQTPQPTYDNSYGNNYLSAQVAQNFYQKINSSADSKGFITDIYIELSPDVVTPSEVEYLNSLSSIFIQVSVDNTAWSSWNESNRKDVVIMIMNVIQKSFPKGRPHITVRNGVRVVAEGSLSFWGNEPTVTLK